MEKYLKSNAFHRCMVEAVEETYVDADDLALFQMNKEMQSDVLGLAAEIAEEYDGVSSGEIIAALNADSKLCSELMKQAAAEVLDNLDEEDYEWEN